MKTISTEYDTSKDFFTDDSMKVYSGFFKIKSAVSDPVSWWIMLFSIIFRDLNFLNPLFKTTNTTTMDVI